MLSKSETEALYCQTNFIPTGSTNHPLVGKAQLIMGLGNTGFASQWYLTGTDTSRLPNFRAVSPASDGIILQDRGYWPVTGTVYTVLGQHVSAATLGPWNYFTVLQDWNSVKNIQLTSVNAEKVQTNGFVHVDVNLGGNSAHGSEVVLLAAKRGNVLTGHGNDYINIKVASNETTWSNEFRINSGSGHDHVKIEAFNLDAFKCQDPYKNLAEGFLKTDGAWQRVYANLENGNDIFDSTSVNTRDYVKAGNGDDVVATGGGDDRVDGGAGRDQINGGNGNDILDAGSNGQYADTYKAFYKTLYSECGCSKDVTGLVNAMKATAEVVVGGQGNDVLVSTGNGSGVDGSDIYTGGTGADTFFFTGRWGFDVITDFVGGTSGDKLALDGFFTGSTVKTGLYVANADGGTTADDLLVVLWQGTSLQAGSQRAILLDDFFTLNNGVIDTTGYKNKLVTATQIDALGTNSIFETDKADHDALKASLGNFYA
ncbi:MAG: hypothetical protein EBQ89_10825 [Alphaproteobacteria bacterium]|nr:hypothetical protein [Alphaproteobacteria bacterium]